MLDGPTVTHKEFLDFQTGGTFASSVDNAASRQAAVHIEYQ